MKIFFITTSSMIDTIISTKKYTNCSNFESIMRDLKMFGFSELFGIDKDNDMFFDTVANSKFIQTKWAHQNNFKYTEKHWEKEILSAQIEKFKPDVLYTGNYAFFNKELKDYLPKAKLYALWNASPMQEGIDLSHFDVGLSFNEVYHRHLQKRGVKIIDYNSFYIDPEIRNRLNSMFLPKDIDIAFVGRYSPMFKERNKFLYDVYMNFRREYNIQYYLLTASRLKGLLPMLPWKLLKAYNKPVFLEDMFTIFARSKIVLNAHSNITGFGKGNMRVFEALGSGSFMLTDNGIYPDHLIQGEDFVVYKSNKDMIDKIDYYLKNDKEREDIALNGYKKISKYYSTDVGSKNLKNIFAKYL
jgi:glycosyltransferase involved in cell wall biosynthesis